ncbi:Peptidoglycan/LPS O-acetylase OafA/YrhL, contains acyltransferase and SGNH-hydrolase domains [Pedobacter westerhofensis]|uniref:Peptidoglycan/LPS O-acetylase OafA/YrhL, contains acyltransferase and SGNH-hydrolase domains n=1 Tax=Pedobacter westerhofensis TaxID=425512 RepID=A0A521B4P9_9SPHI|nr:acyltransferase [Pedobacter westerhofensis]SMO42062.1 Peptidoglycan/LPS O-acetylase OafA/YrhL, contains acyltransferase and SGNH-hydrolase domains [Pedobacter westerhofensis]
MNTVQSDQTILKTRQHFEILDGLRGIAAIAVVIFHFMEFAVPDYKDNFIAHSYLAVDFFFCLSGFVIAYAYDSRVERMGVLRFIQSRLIRLHVLVVIGAVIGLLAFIFDPFSNLYEGYGSGKTLLMFLSAGLMIPYPLVHERYFNLFHLNPPTWSLFWEYIANIFYVFILYKIKKPLLYALVFIAALLLIYEAHFAGNLAVGFGGENFFGGGIRMFYSFLAGIVVYRNSWMIKSSLNFLVMGILLFAVFLIPFHDKANAIIDSAVAIIYFPFLVALGAGAGLHTVYNKVCKFLGDISYPLYMIHYPFLWIFLSYVEAKKPPMNEMVVIISISIFLLIGMAYLVMIYIDAPIRKYLNAKIRKSI